MNKPLPRLRVALPVAYVAGLGYGTVMSRWWLYATWGHAFRTSLLLAAIPVAAAGAAIRRTRRVRARQQALRSHQVPGEREMT